MADGQNFITLKPSQSLSDCVASHIQEEIVRGDLLSGDRIQECRVVDELGVSRGTVREAFRILNRRRLLEIIPRRGVVVANLSPSRVHDVIAFVAIILAHISNNLSDKWSDQQIEHLERALIDSKSKFGWMSPGCAFLVIAEKHSNSVFLESYADLKPTLDRVFAKLSRKQPDKAQIFEPILLNRLLPSFKKGDTAQASGLIHEVCHELERKYLESLERTG